MDPVIVALPPECNGNIIAVLSGYVSSAREKERLLIFGQDRKNLYRSSLIV